MNDKRLWLAVLAAAVTSALVALCVYGFAMQPALQPMGVTNFDSVTLSKNLSVKGNSTLGDAGSDTVTLTGAPSVAGQLTVSNGITVSGNITVGNSVLTISSAGAFATDSTGSFGSQLTASNGITAGGSITVGNSVLTISSAGALASDSTGSFGSELTASNGITVGGNITVGNSVATISSAGAATFASVSGASLVGAADLEHMWLPTVWTEDITFESSGAVVTIPDGEIWVIHDVIYNVTTNFDCTGNDCTLDLGDANDVDGLLNCADGDLQTTFADYTGAQAGWGGLDGSAPRGAYMINGPHVYAPSGSDETIDIAIGGTDPAAGEATIYVIYTRIQ